MLRMLDRMNLTHFSILIVMTAVCAIHRCCCTEQHFDCPLAQHLSPCTCTARVYGLDVVCTDISSVQLREVMDVVSLTRQTIWFLRITRAELSQFPLKLLDGLDLQNLILVQSNITTLDSGSLAGDASRVESLDLSKNCLTKVPSQALSGLKELAALSLDYNCLETLEAHVFSDLVSLLWLSLYGNRIRLIDSRAFLGTEGSLTRLNLGGNRLGQVPRYALQRLNCLQGLRLHDNNISDILVENLPTSLCDLDLSGNDIEYLEAEAFVTLKHLTALDLEDNKIRGIHEDAFKGIHDSLEWLKLGGNKLNHIPQVALRNFSHLRQLDLRCNSIPSIEAQSFQFYGRTLKFIFLQKNKIQRIAEGALDVLESVEWLYLHSNELKELRFNTFRNIIDNLHVLDLHDNPYHCDCDILWFRDWLHLKGQNVVNLPKETRCNTTVHDQKPIVKLTNSSFSCSGKSDITTNSVTLLSLLLISMLTFIVSIR